VEPRSTLGIPYLINNYMKFSEWLINEAIPLDKAKQLTKRARKSYKTLFNNIFGKEHRLVIKSSITEDEGTGALVLRSPVFSQISDFIKRYGYVMEVPDDYAKGIAYKGEDRKNPTKIGKILNKYEEPKEFMRNGKKVFDKPLLDAFKNDPLRQSANKRYSIVISRHPYDIAGMSTDRNWTSCMDLGTDRVIYKHTKNKEGSNANFIDEYVKNPVLIAYLTDPNDVTSRGKPALKRPVSRILLYPFKSEEGEIAYGLGDPYGVKSEKFTEELKKWVNKNLNKGVDNNKIYQRIPYIYYDVYSADFKTEVPIDGLFDIYEKHIRNIDLGSKYHNISDDGKIYDVTLKNFIDRKTFNLFKKIGTVDFRMEDILQLFFIDIYSISSLYPQSVETNEDIVYSAWEDGNVQLNPIEISKIDTDEDDLEKYGESASVNAVLSTLQEFDSKYKQIKQVFAEKVEQIYESVLEMDSDDKEMILDLYELYYAQENNTDYIN
jgi:hypothetical protein